MINSQGLPFWVETAPDRPSHIAASRGVISNCLGRYPMKLCGKAQRFDEMPDDGEIGGPLV
jgi:hypothetical protein